MLKAAPNKPFCQWRNRRPLVFLRYLLDRQYSFVYILLKAKVGEVAQLGEHRLRKAGVGSSNLLFSTKDFKGLWIESITLFGI